MPPKRAASSLSSGASGASSSSSAASSAKRPRTPFRPLMNDLLAESSINEVHDTLKATPDGLAVLSHYRRFGSLSHSVRDELSTRLIYAELTGKLDTKIPVERFQTLAQEITEVFPLESVETWCLVESRNGKQIVTGRLRHKFYNTRRAFIKVGLLSSKVIQDELEEDENLDEAVDFNNDDTMLWLFNNSGPFLELSEKWAESLEKRKLLQKSLSIYDYINKFPCLRQQHGWEMLTSEWEAENILTKEAVQTDWPILLNFLAEQFNKDKQLAEILNACNVDDANERAIVLLSNISSIFKVRTIPKVKGAEETWRPSRPEVQQAFFLHLKRVSDLRETLEHRKETLHRFKHTLQPFVVVVGKDKIEQCLVIVDNIQWVASSPLHALDICFKVFFALDGKFPAEARHIWLLIQMCVYNLETGYDYAGDKGLRSFLACHLAAFKAFVKSQK